MKIRSRDGCFGALPVSHIIGSAQFKCPAGLNGPGFKRKGPLIRKGPG